MEEDLDKENKRHIYRTVFVRLKQVNQDSGKPTEIDCRKNASYLVCSRNILDVSSYPKAEFV